MSARAQDCSLTRPQASVLTTTRVCSVAGRATLPRLEAERGVEPTVSLQRFLFGITVFTDATYTRSIFGCWCAASRGHNHYVLELVHAAQHVLSTPALSARGSHPVGVVPSSNHIHTERISPAANQEATPVPRSASSVTTATLSSAKRKAECVPTAISFSSRPLSHARNS